MEREPLWLEVANEKAIKMSFVIEPGAKFCKALKELDFIQV